MSSMYFFQAKLKLLNVNASVIYIEYSFGCVHLSVVPQPCFSHELCGFYWMILHSAVTSRNVCDTLQQN